MGNFLPKLFIYHLFQKVGYWLHPSIIWKLFWFLLVFIYLICAVSVSITSHPIWGFKSITGIRLGLTIVTSHSDNFQRCSSPQRRNHENRTFHPNLWAKLVVFGVDYYTKRSYYWKSDFILSKYYRNNRSWIDSITKSCVHCCCISRCIL